MATSAAWPPGPARSSTASAARVPMGRPPLHRRYPGDTIVSALAAAGVDVFSRSLKYHRPRGVLTASYLDPGCLRPGRRRAERAGRSPPARGGDGRAGPEPLAVPGLRRQGRQRRWAGSSPPASTTRRSSSRSGSGRLRGGAEALRRRRRGPPSQAAATSTTTSGTSTPTCWWPVAGRPGWRPPSPPPTPGARVMLVEEEHELGGHLRYGGKADLALLAELRRAVAGARRHRGADRLGGHRPLRRELVAVVHARHPGVHERLVKARAKTLVVAPGLIERPYVFAGNDLPGVMLSTAVRRLVNLWAVKPGRPGGGDDRQRRGDAAVADLDGPGSRSATSSTPAGADNVVRARGGDAPRGGRARRRSTRRLRPGRHRHRLDGSDLAAQHGR